MVTLTKVMPDQIPKIWELIENAIKLTSRNPDLSAMLEGILLGRYICWAAVEDESVKLIAITGISDDMYLLVHTVYPYAKLTREEYKKLYEELVVYAKASKCKSIALYTESDKLAKFAEKNGAHIAKYITIPL